jgi:ABC-type transport system involved in multi-copper enzyme maturation permease subunit
MTLASVPVFRKDLRVLIRLLPWFVALSLLSGLVTAVYFSVKGWPGVMEAATEMTLGTQWMMGQLYALVAAAYFLGEERSAGTEVFLRRLAVSRARINIEKIAAGLTAVVSLWACFAVCHALALPLGGLWSSDTARRLYPALGGLWTSSAFVGGLLALACVSAYFVGVLVSFAARQTVVIVLVGVAIWSTGFSLLMLAIDDQLSMSWDMVWLNVVLYAPLVAVPVVMALPGRRFRFSRRATWPLSGRTRMLGLIWKSIAENTLLQVACIVFLAAALVVPLETDSWFVTVGALILIAALGTAAYVPAEKQGLHCLLYQHPVPRSQLFWAKTIAAIVPVLAVSVGAFLLWSRLDPMPFLTALALGAFAYACAVLLTLTLRRQVDSLLATAAIIAMTIAIPLVIRDYFQPAQGIPGEQIFGLLLGAAGPLALLAAGCLMAARRMATDRAVLTGSPRHRLAYFARVYFVIMAVSAVVTLAAWPDLVSSFMRG